MPAEHAYVPDMPQLMTAEELLYTNVPNKRTELVRGRLIVHEPPGGRHGYVAANLAFRLNKHIDLTGAGAVFVGDVGFTLHRDPDTVRGPDVAFVRKTDCPNPFPTPISSSRPTWWSRCCRTTSAREKCWPKFGDWLDAGARLVWVIDPERPAGLQLHAGIDSRLGRYSSSPLRAEVQMGGISLSPASPPRESASRAPRSRRSRAEPTRPVRQAPYRHR